MHSPGSCELILNRLKLFGPYRVDRLAQTLDRSGASISVDLRALATSGQVEIYAVRGRAWVRATPLLPPPDFDSPLIPACLLQPQP